MGGGPFHPFANGTSQSYTLHWKETADDELFYEHALYMDPLSFVASIITVVTIAGTTAKQLSHLCRALQHAPAEVHALNNEVVDLQSILQAIQAVADAEDYADGGEGEAQRNLHNGPPQAPGAMIIVHLDRAKEKLSDLGHLIQKCIAKGHSFHFQTVWLRERSKAQALQRELRNIRINLQTALLLITSWVALCFLLMLFADSTSSGREMLVLN